MKMISLLLTLGIIGFLVWKQLGGESATVPVTQDGAATGTAPPRISGNPADVPAFDAAMDDYLDQQSSQRRAEIDARSE